MKILSPKYIMLILIVVFLIVNFIFLFQYLFGKENSSKKHLKKKDVVGYLKRYVKFNNTNFEKGENLYFYYDKYEESKALHNKYIINNTNFSNENFEYFFDQIEKVIVDEIKNVCFAGEFNLTNNLCNFNGAELINTSLCDMNVKCCSKSYLCFYNCINEKNTNLTNFNYCDKKCQANDLNNNNFCYYHKNDFKNWEKNINLHLVKLIKILI
jgi:hypothetical protein